MDEIFIKKRKYLKGHYFNDEEEYVEKHHPFSGYAKEEGGGHGVFKDVANIIDLDAYEENGCPSHENVH